MTTSVHKNSTDNTEPENTSAKLYESEETLRVYIENSFDIIFTLNSAGEFVFISPSWERHFGFLVSDAIGRSFAQFIHTDDVAALFAYLERVLSTGQSETSPAYRVKHVNGQWLWFIANGSLFYNKKGERKFIGVAHDITDRKLAEDALIESETKYRELVENSPDAIAIYVEGIVVFVNNECLRLMAAKSAEELIGKPVMVRCQWHANHR